MEVAEARRLEEENARLKRLVADQALDIKILKEVNSKKMVSPMQKRNAVKHVVTMGRSRRSRVCRVFGLARSSMHYQGRVQAAKLRQEGLIEVASRSNPV